MTHRESLEVVLLGNIVPAHDDLPGKVDGPDQEPGDHEDHGYGDHLAAERRHGLARGKQALDDDEINEEQEYQQGSSEFLPGNTE